VSSPRPSLELDVPEGEPAAPYRSSGEHLLAELAHVDLLVRMQVARARQAAGDERLRGLAITEEEVDALLERPPGAPGWTAAPPQPELAEVERMLARELALRTAASCREGARLRLLELQARFELQRFDVELLLIALAPELDTRYERLYAYLHDDVTRRRPSVELALSLLCETLETRLMARVRLEPDAPLVRHGLVELFTDAPQTQPPFIARYLKVSERVVAYLCGSDALDARLERHARLVEPSRELDALVLPAELKTRLRGLLDGDAPPILFLRGGYGVGKKAVAEALAHALGAGLLIVDGAPAPEAQEVAALALREARLGGHVVYWEDFDALEGGAPERVARRFVEYAGLVVLGGAGAWEPSGALRSSRFVRVELDAPDFAAQLELWARALAVEEPGPEPELDVARIASSYQLSGGQIHDAAAAARGLARLRGARAVCAADLVEACRRRSQPRLGALARRITAEHGWDDLILPPDRLERLNEIVQRARHRARVLDAWGWGRKLSSGKGLSALFTGPPGTGKTLAASVLARELGLDLFQIDLSAVVSKYIGETEKQLARVFDEAERGRAVLFFDEADALFGKRSEVHDAHDRYANIETSYLLQRLESYEGVAVLASNFSRNMDEAFVRRLSFVVEFPLPGELERRRIWERVWPDGAPRAASLDLASLARRFELTGGHIRNIALAAAFLAADEGADIEQRHLMRAARREYQKMGKMIDESLFTGKK